MTRRSPRDGDSLTTEPDEQSLRWAWAAGLLVPVVAFGCLAWAVLATPGSPWACRIPNPSAWWLCAWTRAFVSNAVTAFLGVAGGAVLLAVLVGVSRAVFGHARP